MRKDASSKSRNAPSRIKRRCKEQEGRIEMATRRGVLGGTLAGAALFSMPAVVRGQSARTLRFSHTDTPQGAAQKAAELFAERVGQYTEGRYRVQVFHSGQVANDQRSLEQLQVGGLDFALTGVVTFTTHVRPLSLIALPYLAETYEQGWKLYDNSGFIKAQKEALAQHRMRFVGDWEAGFRSFTTTFPINTPADLKGKKVRIAPVEMVRWIMETLEANAVVMPVTEVYLAIQQGTVLGQENPVDTIYSQRFYEVAKNITLSQHVYSPRGSPSRTAPTSRSRHRIARRLCAPARRRAISTARRFGRTTTRSWPR
jgi:tripartite ATP-independent transporter DctP family solute receptor